MPDLARVVVVGSINTDLVVRTPRLPSPGETVLGGDLLTVGGGKGANQAVAAARLGAVTTLIGRVGADPYGQQALRRLAADGVDCAGVRTDPFAPSGVALVLVDDGGENMIAVAPGANTRLTPADVEAATLAAGGVLLLQLEIPLDVVRHAAGQARRACLRVVLNPAPAQALPADLYPLLDVVVPNEHEASLLAGIAAESEQGARVAAEWLRRQGAGAVILTRGAKGALLLDEAGWQDVPAYPIVPLDTTAAGDSFAGTLAWALAAGQTLR